MTKTDYVKQELDYHNYDIVSIMNCLLCGVDSNRPKDIYYDFLDSNLVQDIIDEYQDNTGLDLDEMMLSSEHPVVKELLSRRLLFKGSSLNDNTTLYLPISGNTFEKINVPSCISVFKLHSHIVKFYHTRAKSHKKSISEVLEKRINFGSIGPYQDGYSIIITM